MIESNFEYTENLIGKINAISIKKYNVITEIFMAIILIGSGVLFAVKSILLGGIFLAIFIMLTISLCFSNRSINKSNSILVGQKVNIKFDEDKMHVTTKLGNKVLYSVGFEYQAIKKVVSKPDLVFVYFDRVSAVIIPKNSFNAGKEYKKAMEYLNNNYVM